MLNKIVCTVVVLFSLAAVAWARGGGGGHGSSTSRGGHGARGGKSARSFHKAKGTRKRRVTKKSVRKSKVRKKKNLAKSKHRKRKGLHKTRTGTDKTRKRSMVKKFSPELINKYAAYKKYLKNRVLDKDYHTKYGKSFRFQVNGVVKAGWKYFGKYHRHWEFFFFNTYYQKWLFFDPCTDTYYYYCGGCDCYRPIEFICCKCLGIADDPEFVPCDACAAGDEDEDDNGQTCCGQSQDDDDDGQGCCGQLPDEEEQDAD